VPEATNTCPSCGNQIEAAYQACPNCGAQQRQLGLVGKLQIAVGALLGTTKTHPMPWMIGGGVVGVAAIAAVVVFGGFLGPSGKDICMASLTQARDFGVIAPSASLVSNSAKSTDVNNRKQCSVQADGETFTLLADVKSEDTAHKVCKDFKKQTGCIALYSVARSDGMTTYQVRQIPPDETDEALAAQSPPPPLPGAAPAAAADPGGLDTDTAVDNSGPAQGTAAQTPPPAPQQ
jgi:hypothetical protein